MVFLFKLTSFLFGYVGILVRGESLEKFLNLAAGRGIYLWDIKRTGENEIFVKARLSAVKPLRHIGRKARCKFHFQQREGLPFMVSRIKKRKSMVLGAAVFLAGLYILSSFIWFIDVTGAQSLPAEEIKKIAAEAGLRTGAARFSINRENVEKQIINGMPEISYVGVTIRGTRATIEIAEKTIIPEEEVTPSDIVAKKSGLVKEVLVLVGNPMVKEGDTVVPGQVLISGVIPPPQEEPENLDQNDIRQTPPRPATYVQARGVVRARVWYEGYAEVPMSQQRTGDTGNSFARLCINFKGKEIILSGKQQIPFDNYRVERSVKKLPVWRNISIPVELVTLEYLEVQRYNIHYSRKEAAQLARSKALTMAKSGVESKAVIVEEHANEIVSINPDNLVRYKAYIETLEDIGAEKRLSQQD